MSAEPSWTIVAPLRPRFRDTDAMGHVNNAVYWSAVEERLDGVLGPGALGRATIEFRDGIAWGEQAGLLDPLERAAEVRVPRQRKDAHVA